MAPDSRTFHRSTNRMRGRSYAQPGRYFVTICVQGKACLLGAVVHGQARLNAPGRLVRDVWGSLDARFPGVEAEDLVVMPNHVHAILRLGERARVGFGEVVGAFKSLTTVAYGRGVRRRSWVRYERRLWQRNFWERVLRDDDEVMRARHYILMNPARWDKDPLRADG